MAILLNGWIFPIEQSGEASRWRVCYQWGLPHLVFSKYEVIAEAASTFTHLNNSLFCLTPSCTFQMRHSKQHQCLYKRHRISLVRQWLQLYKSTLFCRLSTYFLCMKVQNISESRGITLTGRTSKLKDGQTNKVQSLSIIRLPVF